MQKMEKMKNKVHNMDCIEFMKRLPDNSIDSCVTDPPYGLNFMNKAWDSGAITFNKEVWELLFQKLKYGAHIAVFGGTRTYHRMVCAIEDAGFEIRDQLAWIYGSGFPKGLNISKTIDRKHGFDGTTDIPKQTARSIERGYYETTRTDLSIQGGRFADPTREKRNGDIKTHYLPISPEAIEWQGWNTALKPAQEPILLARKPLKEKTIVDNILKHGAGAINIDACRIRVDPTVDDMHRTVERKERETATWRDGSGFKNEHNEFTGVLPSGRYPTNVILSHHRDCVLVQEGKTEVRHIKREATETTGKGVYSDGWIRNPNEYSFGDGVPEIWNCVEGCPIKLMNEQSGIRPAGGRITGHELSHKMGDAGIYNKIEKTLPRESYNDIGGAARFFYCAKAQKKERNAGLGYYLKAHIMIVINDAEVIIDDISLKSILFEESNDEMITLTNESFSQLDILFTKETVPNPHITVKPIDIMRYLIRMITPVGGTVIDPFAGSGTTAIAAVLEEMNFLTCDISSEYVDVSRKRLAYWKNPPKITPKKKKLATKGQETLAKYFEE